MPEGFYQNAGKLISPGDLLDLLPYIRVPRPLKVFRKASFTLPAKYVVQGELGQAFEAGKHSPSPPLDFSPKAGEHGLVTTKMSKAIFLTWGSEVEDDERSGQLHKKDWLIAPLFPLAELNVNIPNAQTGSTINMADAIRSLKTPKFFPLPSLPEGESTEWYVDFRKIGSVSATYFPDMHRTWRLSPTAINDFYSHLMWFFTRQRMFFSPVPCGNCGQAVDLRVVFEGQAINPNEP
jgi:hypothetical protein